MRFLKATFRKGIIYNHSLTFNVCICTNMSQREFQIACWINTLLIIDKVWNFIVSIFLHTKGMLTRILKIDGLHNTKNRERSIFGCKFIVYKTSTSIANPYNYTSSCVKFEIELSSIVHKTIFKSFAFYLFTQCYWLAIEQANYLKFLAYVTNCVMIDKRLIILKGGVWWGKSWAPTMFLYQYNFQAYFMCFNIIKECLVHTFWRLSLTTWASY